MTTLDTQARNTPARTAEVYRAAAELMVSKGFGGTSIGDIAKAVGMTKAGLYHHIDSKQDMLFQIMSFVMDMFDEQLIHPASQIDDPTDRLRQIIRLYVNGLIDHGLAFAVLMSEVDHLDIVQRKKIIKRKKRYYKLVHKTLSAMDDQGLLRQLDISIATMHFVFTLRGISQWPADQLPKNTEHLIEQTQRLILNGLLK